MNPLTLLYETIGAPLLPQPPHHFVVRDRRLRPLHRSRPASRSIRIDVRAEGSAAGCPAAERLRPAGVLDVRVEIAGRSAWLRRLGTRSLLRRLRSRATSSASESAGILSRRR